MTGRTVPVWADVATRCAFVILSGAAILLTPGCGKQGSDAGADSGIFSGLRKDDSRMKLGAYTQTHNILLRAFGLTEAVDSYTALDIAHKSPADSITISYDELGSSIRKLKDARALPGGTAAVDGAADTLITALTKASMRLDALRDYYAVKAYKADDLARGKREDPLMLAELQAAKAAFRNFEKVIDTERSRHEDVELADMKARGDLLDYDTKLALRQAKNVLDLFENAGTGDGQAVLTKTDGLIGTLETTLVQQRAELSKRKAAAKSSAGEPNYSYGRVGDNLTTFVGDYRDLRAMHDPRRYQDMVGHYNDAISDANNLVPSSR